MATDSDFYQRRIAKVMAHIARHLESSSGELSLESLAQVAGMSKFHFHRQFAAYTGITVIRLVALMRLKHASLRLAFCPDDRVTDIALDAGYGSPEAFARAFRELQQQSPSEFRGAPAWAHWAQTFRTDYTYEEPSMNVDIVDFSPTQVAVLEHHGAPQQLMASVAKFIEWRKASGASPPATHRTYGVVYSDPDSVPAEEFRFDICAAVDAPVAPNPWGVGTRWLAGGPCAVATHRGSTDAIGPSVMQLYRQWLPTSGFELRDAPLFFHYKRRMPEVSEPEQVTDIYLPVRRLG